MAAGTDPGGGALVRLAEPLARLFPDAPRRLRLPARTVSDLLDALDDRWPGLRDRVCDGTPAIRRHMVVFVDGERADLDTPVAPGSDVYILTAISGG